MTESSTPKEPRRQILGIDPGMATLIAAVLALVGTVLTLLVQMPRGSGQTPTPGSPTEGVVTTPTAIVTTLPSGESTPTGSPANPTFSVVSALAPEARATAVVAGRAEALAHAQSRADELVAARQTADAAFIEKLRDLTAAATRVADALR